MTQPGAERSSGTLGYFIRKEKRSVNEDDWRAYLQLADKHFNRPQAQQFHDCGDPSQ